MWLQTSVEHTNIHTHTYTQGLSHVLCRSSFNGEKSSGRWVKKGPAHRLWYVLLSIRSSISWANSGLNIRLPVRVLFKQAKKVTHFSILYSKVHQQEQYVGPQISTPSPAVGFYPPSVRGAQSQ